MRRKRTTRRIEEYLVLDVVRDDFLWCLVRRWRWKPAGAGKEEEEEAE